MTQLERIASDHRVRIRQDVCGDPIIPGKNGHLYTDGRAVMACFTDDGRKRPFSTKYFKTSRMKMIQPFTVRFRQEGEYEFIAEIRDEPEAIRTALFRVLGVKRRMKTFGVSKPVPPEFEAARSRRALPGAKTVPQAPGRGI